MTKIIVNKKKINIKQNSTKIYPTLENLTVIPSGEQQTFKHPNSYGYDEVVVNAVETEILNITPKEETQNFVGLYGEVNVDKITTEEKTPNLDFSNNDVIEVKPSENRYLKKVTINKDEDLLPQNIKSGVDIFGVSGTGEMANFEINDCRYLFYQGSRDNAYDELIKLVKNPTSIAYMFAYSNLKKIDLSNIKSSNVLGYMESAFINAQLLEELNISNLVTDNIKSLYMTFYETRKLAKIIGLETLDVSNVENFQSAFHRNYVLEDFTFLDIWNFDNATNMSHMLQDCRKLEKTTVLKDKTLNRLTNLNTFLSGCSELKEVDFSNFTAPLLTQCQFLFYQSPELKKANISNWNVPKLTNSGYLFYQCSGIETVIIDGQTVFPMSNINMFTSTPIAKGTGYIYVPDNMVDTYKSATNWSTYADQIKPMSELPVEEN